MAMNDFTDGEVLYGAQLDTLYRNAMVTQGCNVIRQLEDRTIAFSAGQIEGIGEAYIDADGRLDAVYTEGTTAEFDTDKYKTSIGDNPFVVIEASAISSITDFAINDCIIEEIDTGKWLLRCTSGTAEERRAKLYKTLFYGTGGGNARASSTYITTITALKTSVTRDVGKQAHYAQAVATDDVDDGWYTGTFANTTTNDDFSSWSYCTNLAVTSDETGTDTTADEFNNPADCRLDVDAFGGTGDSAKWQAPAGTNINTAGDNNDNDVTCKVYMLCEGDITWATNNLQGTITASNIDFLTDNGIPAFTATTESIGYEVVHTFPTGTIGDTVSTAILVPMIEDWEDGADIQYKLQTLVDSDNLNNTTEYLSESNTYATYITKEAWNSTCPEVTNEIKTSNGSNTVTCRVRFNYLDGTNVTDIQTSTSTSYVAKTHTNPNPTKLLKSIEVELKTTNNTYDSFMKNNAATLTSTATEADSGWLSCGTSPQVSAFTAFTDTPTFVRVKLIPKSTSPTAGYPSINGVWVRAE